MQRLILLLAAVLLAGTLIQVGKNAGEAMAQGTEYQEATFAGGCFWCVESDFEKVPGVIKAVSGYSGGEVEDPSYEQVSSGTTGHRESVRVVFDPGLISYEQLLQYYWRMFDPTDPDGSFGDRGFQYTSAIFYHDDVQKEIAERSKAELDGSGRYRKPVVTPVIPLVNFYPAEGYHQDYYKTHSGRYSAYRLFSGRDHFLKKAWGEELKLTHEPPGTGGEGGGGQYSRPTDAELRERLTDLQYKVTQREGTERPFDNEYWDNKEPGIYVDIVSGEPLFSSTDKYKSGTGWPSFTRPLVPENIVEKEDRSWFSVRTEVRSKYADSHLGHVFADGPPPTGLRYCLNSAALRFIPARDLDKEGYGEFRSLFE